MPLKKILLAVVLILIFLPALTYGEEFSPAPDFTASTVDGRTFSLTGSRGNVTILHVQNFENPICIECEKELRGQIEALAELAAREQTNLTIVTLNLRKNPSSDDGKTLAERWYDINVTWYWIEEEAPYPVADDYRQYWTVDGAFANPTLVLIGPSLDVMGVYHVYRMGTGKLDGVQPASSLAEDAEQILQGNWTAFRGKTSSRDITFLGMFALGMITALSPCSIALLISMISYVGATGGGTGTRRESIRGLGMGIVFTLGMALVFFFIGLLISYAGFFVEISSLFYLITGVILLILGVNIVVPLKERVGPLFKSKGGGGNIMEKGGRLFESISKKSLLLGAFFLGILFAVGWAPCAISLVMPVFILVLA
ncbi:MAG TPA: cytochrome c biogenesis protein [Thermoplasmatales archaeon]|nr:cytochrome c biogenesis protein [Thermoplasmatales archaeon]